MKLASLAFVVLVAASASAQEKRVVIRAGGPAGDATKGWPKITAKAASDAAIPKSTVPEKRSRPVKSAR